MGDVINVFCGTNVVKPQHEFKICFTEKYCKSFENVSPVYNLCEKMHGFQKSIQKVGSVLNTKGIRKPLSLTEDKLYDIGVRKERSPLKCLCRLAVQNVALIFSAHRARKLSKSRTHKARAVQKPLPSVREERSKYFIRFSKPNGFLDLELVFSRMNVVYKGM